MAQKILAVGRSLGAPMQRSLSIPARSPLSGPKKSEMTSCLCDAGGVPVIAERMHEGIPLPETNKPKFRVPSSLTIEQFSEVRCLTHL